MAEGRENAPSRDPESRPALADFAHSCFGSLLLSGPAICHFVVAGNYWSSPCVYPVGVQYVSAQTLALVNGFVLFFAAVVLERLIFWDQRGLLVITDEGEANCRAIFPMLSLAFCTHGLLLSLAVLDITDPAIAACPAALHVYASVAGWLFFAPLFLGIAGLIAYGAWQCYVKPLFWERHS